jgi:hypothetical protein
VKAETYDYISNAINELLDALADDTLSDNEVNGLRKAIILLEEIIED